MTKTEFIEMIKEEIPAYLPDMNISEIQVQEVAKNNENRTGLMIKTESNITPTIYVDEFYADYENGDIEFKEILTSIADMRRRYDKPDMDVNSITNWDSVKDKVFIRLVSKDNVGYLHGKVYREKLDMAITYAIMLDMTEVGTASTAVTMSLLDEWDITIKTLHQTAMKNMSGTAQFQSMAEVIAGIMHCDPEDLMEDGQPPMYVLSNNTKLNGAAEILDEDLMKQISAKIGGDFIILPSSIHEVIILPVSDDHSVEDLEAMVNEVNASEVDPVDRLTNSVYRYSAATGEIRFAA